MSKTIVMTHPEIKDSKVEVLESTFEKVWKAEGWKKDTTASKELPKEEPK